VGGGGRYRTTIWSQSRDHAPGSRVVRRLSEVGGGNQNQVYAFSMGTASPSDRA
jgi:hypothetical protein